MNIPGQSQSSFLTLSILRPYSPISTNSGTLNFLYLNFLFSFVPRVDVCTFHYIVTT